MMVMAAGYRLLPMVLPAPPPTGRGIRAGAATAQVGVLGLAVTLYTGRGALAPFALLFAAGVGVFLSRVGWMLRHRRPPSAARPRPGIARFHVAAALVWLTVATALGLAVALAPTAPWRQSAILLYGAAGLVGFLAQVVVVVAGRTVPLGLWPADIGGRDQADRPPSPDSPAHRRLWLAVLALWTVGVPLLLAGLGLDDHLLIRAAAILLTLAALGGSGRLGIAWRSARRAGLPMPSR